MSKQSTKSCPVCGNTNLVLFTTMNKKVCTNHSEYVMIPWYLEKGQKPLFDESGIDKGE